MPGFDGTGPQGMGPMTGGGRGFCSPWGVRSARRYPIPPWPGYGYRYYGGRQSATGPQMTTGEEIETLRAQAHELSQHLVSIQQRISELENKV